MHQGFAEKVITAGSVGFYRNRIPVFSSLAEGYDAIRSGKKGVILANADVGTGMKLGAALANDDVAGTDRFTAKPFYAEAFRFRIATVLS